MTALDADERFHFREPRKQIDGSAMWANLAGDSTANLHLRKHKLKSGLRYSPNDGGTFVAENHSDIVTLDRYETAAAVGVAGVHVRNRCRNLVFHVLILRFGPWRRNGESDSLWVVMADQDPMSKDAVDQFRRSLSMLSEFRVRDIYREAHERCKRVGDKLPNPQAVQEPRAGV